MKKYLTTILRLWKLLQPFHKFLYLQIGLIFAIQLTTTGFTVLFSRIIDELIAKDTMMLLVLLGIFPVIAVIATLANYAADKNEVKHLETPIEQYLQEFSFKKIFSLNAFQYLESHSAIKLQVINRGEAAIQEIIQTLTLQGLPAIFSLVISLSAITFYSPRIGLWTALTFLALLYATNKFNAYFGPLISKNMDNWDAQRKIRTEAFSHLPLIKLSGQEDSYLKLYLSRRLHAITYSISIWITSAQYISGRNLFVYVSRFFSLALVVLLFMEGNVTVGVVYAIFSWTSDVYGSIQSINRIFRRLPLRFVELTKYLYIIDQHAEFDEEKTTRYKSGIIEFKNVSFKYPHGTYPVLENVSFSINPGEKVAFVGHSGSGKSTITKLLLRMYEWNDGDILIGGKSIRELSTRKLRHKVGYVEQHVDLFDDTVKENILFGIEDHKRTSAEKDLDTIVKQSRIDQFFHRLGDSRLDTIIGEKGIKLSGGERQRIGIARAIIKDPDILIFDEATSSLDTKNEKYVMDAIKDVSIGKTTIIIAHRLSTVRDADKIFVMDKGKIVETGTHDELLLSSIGYKTLVEAQMTA